MMPDYSERRRIIKDAILESIEVLSPNSIISKRDSEISGFIRKVSSYSIFSLGKASSKMCMGLSKEIIEGSTNSICLSPVGSFEPNGFRNYHGNHPYPGKDTFTSSKEIMETLSNDESEGLLVMLSGGASSMFEVPDQDISQERYLEIMNKLIREDYSIEIINEVRCRLSQVKCGKILSLIKYAKIKIFAISDVPGDRISVIGSNPFYPADQHIEIPEELRYSIKSLQNDKSNVLRKDIKLPEYSIILSGSIYSKGLIDLIETEFPKVDMGQIIKGNVEDLAPSLMKSIREKYSEINSPFWFTAHGESTATVTGKGRGGRNTYLSSLIIEQANSDEIFSFISFATDGVDGNSDLAGFIVDENIRNTVDKNIIENFIMESDTANLALKCGTDLNTGPTGNNVSDVIIGFYGGKSNENTLQ